MSNTKKIVLNMGVIKSNTPKTRKKQTNLVPLVPPNKLKTELINKIRHKAANTSNTIIAKDTTEDQFSDEFCKSIEYLNNIKKNRVITGQQQQKQKQQQQQQIQPTPTSRLEPKLIDYTHARTVKNHSSVQLELPDELIEPPKISEMRMSDLESESVPIKISKVESPPQTSYKIDTDVEHGCLKNGLKPCFRTWKSSQTRKNAAFQDQQPAQIIHSNPIHSNPIHSKPIQAPIENIAFTISEQIVSNDTDTIDKILQPTISSRNKKIIKKTTSKTYELGKSTKYRRVGVLIKNKNTRKLILQAYNKLKKTPIHEIKKQLKQQGLIKVGTTAPSDMLRHTFESSIMAGEITNKNDEILVHNFMNEKEENK